MFVAIDAQGNRLYADSGIKCTECFCPVCNEAVKHKPGNGGKKPHFAHKPDSNCIINFDKDYKSEWHIRMQEYFPKEAREITFKDEETGEIHRADIFVKDANTVIEFQHSPISEEEFLSRTLFHLKGGRRIAWLFDESSSSKGEKAYGRFKSLYVKPSNPTVNDWLNEPYSQRSYKWLRNPRSFLEKGPSIKKHAGIYSVCVYTGTEGDIFHRLISEEFGFEEVCFSIHEVAMKEAMDVDEFFKAEDYWQSQDPWKDEFKQRKDILEELRQIYEQQQQTIQQRAFSQIRTGYYRRGRRF